MITKDQFTIREPKPTDLNFILATFSMCMKKESSLGKSCSPQVFYPNFTKIIDHLLEHSEVRIAADTETDTILGYIVYDHEAVHFIYVKAVYRNLHIGKDLLRHAFPEAEQIAYTLQTKASRDIRDKYPELIHNPFIIYQKDIKWHDQEK